MPIVRCGAQIIYYAHVPKCAGSAVEDYLAARFGPLAFRDTRHFSRPAQHRWSRTSPQHVDAATLARLFPEGFFDLAFAVVRHPVDRLVSAWHFQLEVEGTVPLGVGFSDWLQDIAERRAVEPFAFDNHTRPMDEIVPATAQIFRLEDGLDQIVPWLDRVTGLYEGPRALGQSNRRGERGRKGTSKVRPDAADLALIADLYAADFARFGYTSKAVPDEPADTAPARPRIIGQLKERFGR